jgi:hypothetical protein
MRPVVGQYLAKRWTNGSFSISDVEKSLTVSPPWATFLATAYLRDLVDENLPSFNSADSENVRRAFLAYSMSKQFVCVASNAAWMISAIDQASNPRPPGNIETKCVPPQIGEENFQKYSRRSAIHWPRSSLRVDQAGLFTGGCISLHQICATLCWCDHTRDLGSL